MDLEINNLWNSNYDMLSEFGKLLYYRENQDGGLTKEELNELLKIVNENRLDAIFEGEINNCRYNIL